MPFDEDIPELMFMIRQMQALVDQAGGRPRENLPDDKPGVWLSADPGHDDAMAMILAGHHPRLKLLGVDTVAANQSLEKVTRNALNVLDAAGLEHIPVVRGQARPLLRPPLECPEIHGDSGLDLRSGSLPPTDRKPWPGKAVNSMASMIVRYWCGGARQVHIVCTAALTNVALLLMLYPEVAECITQVVVMGGALGLGNTHPAAEFNIQVDPEAAKYVFESGVPVVMVPLEVTHTALATDAVLARLTARDSRFLALVREMLLFFADTYRTVFGFTQGPPIHDPCAVAYVAAPEIFRTQKMRVEIETASPLTAGRTVCDVYNRLGKPPNVTVAMAMDVERFWQMMLDAIFAADQASKLNAAQ